MFNVFYHIYHFRFVIESNSNPSICFTAHTEVKSRADVLERDQVIAVSVVFAIFRIA